MTIDACICENCLTKNHCDVLPYSNNCNEVRAMAKHDKQVYNKAIDDFVNACKEDILCQTFGLHVNGIERIAEQLKAGDRENGK